MGRRWDQQQDGWPLFLLLAVWYNADGPQGSKKEC
jgi:hypothetical protein